MTLDEQQNRKWWLVEKNLEWENEFNFEYVLLEQCFLKYGPWTSSISWNFLEIESQVL